jgi:hypothetical protein
VMAGVAAITAGLLARLAFNRVAERVPEPATPLPA